VINGGWLFLYTLLRNKFDVLNKSLGNQVYHMVEIDQLIILLDDLDRVNELGLILDRAVAKSKGSVENTQRKDSPLKVIKVLLSMKRMRPNWTYNPGSY